MIVATKQISVEEFRQIEFDENDDSYYELINGYVMKKSAPRPEHQRISMKLSRTISNYLFSKPIGEVFAAPIDVFLNGFNAVQPDLLFISSENNHFITTDGIIGVPDLIIEIISPTSIIRDRVDKKNLYEKLNVKEYWIVDAQYKDIEVYTIENGRYELLSGVTMFEGELKSNVLAGIEIQLSEVFD